jgi:hypothetical protein
MRFQIGVLRSTRGWLAIGLLLCACCLTTVSRTQQAGTATQQNIMLKDPTPRPPDLDKVYGTDPAEQARLQAAATLRNAQIREQVVKATDKLCQLAQELRDDVNRGGKDTPSSLNAAKAAKIEKLAKSVREKMQMQ